MQSVQTNIASSSTNIFGMSTKMLIGASAAVVTIGGVGYWFYSRSKRDVLPLKWRRIGTLQQINVFPVKSCAPIKDFDQSSFECGVLGISNGIVHDRKFMLINDNNEMITARGYPHMVQIQPKPASNGLEFNAPDMPVLYLDFGLLDKAGTNVHTAVWGVPLDAKLCGTQFDKWFSKFILGNDYGLRLVYYPYQSPVRTTVNRLKHMPFLKQEDSGTFNDATSYMLMNLSSIDDLNKRLKNPVEPLQFRGNFELKMDVDEPYAEDHWQWIRIGEETVFRVVAPCTRCILPNINVSTAKRDPDGEPLKTLRSYRLFDYSSPALGIHLGLRIPGNVKINDTVYIESK